MKKALRKTWRLIFPWDNRFASTVRVLSAQEIQSLGNLTCRNAGCNYPITHEDESRMARYYCITHAARVSVKPGGNY